jgi:hypothetical protein
MRVEARREEVRDCGTGLCLPWVAYTSTFSFPCCSSMCVLVYVSIRLMTQDSYSSSYLRAPCVLSSLQGAAA